MIITIAGEKILLRPTFENMAMMEGKLGSIGSMIYKYGAAAAVSNLNHATMMKSLPPLNEAAQIIFFNQAEKKYSIDEIYEKCLEEGIKVGAEVLLFLVRCTSGNTKLAEPTEKQKKNSKKPNLVENP